MLGGNNERQLFISGKISHVDGVCATILLETGQKIQWPKKNLPVECIFGALVKVSIACNAAQHAPKNKNQQQDAKFFLNLLLHNP